MEGSSTTYHFEITRSERVGRNDTSSGWDRASQVFDAFSPLPISFRGSSERIIQYVYAELTVTTNVVGVYDRNLGPDTDHRLTVVRPVSGYLIIEAESTVGRLQWPGWPDGESPSPEWTDEDTPPTLNVVFIPTTSRYSAGGTWQSPSWPPAPARDSGAIVLTSGARLIDDGRTLGVYGLR